MLSLQQAPPSSSAEQLCPRNMAIAEEMKMKGTHLTCSWRCFAAASKARQIEIEESWESSPEHSSKEDSGKRKSDGVVEKKRSTPQSGAILGKPYVKIEQMYEMKKELGSGQWGVTYLCVEKMTQREYACKSIAKTKLVSAQEIEDVRREVMILQHLSRQPNIVEFRGPYRTETTCT
ncbi:calcium-dependent protein kinase [Vigna unguiculata]|uniref:Calcium-dependent protein kinase n=1 Tax=Vigna unguiculata TaxID=3917 RepID=A0A4D6MI46_VIGUN|nr:calcium-dependent protein kinase [Vigna unguiculata]